MLVSSPTSKTHFHKREKGSGELHIHIVAYIYHMHIVVSCHTVWCGLITLQYLITLHIYTSTFEWLMVLKMGTES